jgi:hypothetical protein
MPICIDPEAVQEGDFVAFLEGEANERVRDHLRLCPACSERLTQISQTNRHMFSLLYRASCPTPEVLGQYQMDLLTPAEKLVVAAHMRNCSLCTSELTQFQASGDPLINRIMDTIQQAVHILVAVRIDNFQTSGVRGESGPQRLYRAGGLDILIGFQPDAPGRKTGTLAGSIVQAEEVTGGNAWLFQDDQEPKCSQVDTSGSFVFEHMAPSETNLALSVNDQVIILREVLK